MSDDLKRYFGNDDNSIRAALGRMVQESYREANCAQDKTYELVRQKMDYDRRLDGFDKNRLKEKLIQTGKNGGHLDLSDPYLRPGGSKRPFER